MSNGYTGPFWIFISVTGMPISVEKCTFKPNIKPHGCDGDWTEAYIGGHSRRLELESKIYGLTEAMRPLLSEWAKIAKEDENQVRDE